MRVCSNFLLHGPCIRTPRGWLAFLSSRYRRRSPGTAAAAAAAAPTTPRVCVPARLPFVVAVETGRKGTGSPTHISISLGSISPQPGPPVYLHV